MCNIKKGEQKKLYLGNLNAKRDWGHTKDYVVAMWKMLQQSKPKDYVISTGKQHSIKEFINKTAKILKMKIKWKGKGFNENALWNNKEIISIDKKYIRPTEVDSLKGNSKLAQKELNWKPKYNIDSLILEMVQEELKN